MDGTGKGQQPFIAPLAGAKYRLGNEAETYLESTFAYGVTSEDEDPAYFDTRITLAYVAPTSQSNTFATTFSLREAFALARRVWAAQPNATLYQLGRFFSLATEAGWDYTTQSDLPGGSLFKLTAAPQITPRLKYFSRPALRAFATWAHCRPWRRLRSATGIVVVMERT